MSMTRSVFAEGWKSIDKVGKPHRDALYELDNAKGALIEAMGRGEPLHWCEGCGVPFFAGDDYQIDHEGIASCRFDQDGKLAGPCFDDG